MDRIQKIEDEKFAAEEAERLADEEVITFHKFSFCVENRS